MSSWKGVLISHHTDTCPQSSCFSRGFFGDMLQCVITSKFHWRITQTTTVKRVDVAQAYKVNSLVLINCLWCCSKSWAPVRLLLLHPSWKKETHNRHHRNHRNFYCCVCICGVWLNISTLTLTRTLNAFFQLTCTHLKAKSIIFSWTVLHFVNCVLLILKLLLVCLHL